MPVRPESGEPTEGERIAKLIEASGAEEKLPSVMVIIDKKPKQISGGECWARIRFTGNIGIPDAPPLGGGFEVIPLFKDLASLSVEAADAQNGTVTATYQDGTTHEFRYGHPQGATLREE
jgi:hypothetical protein